MTEVRVGEEREVVELERRTPGEHERFRVERVGRRLTAVRGSVGQAEQARTEVHADAYQAQAALVEMLRARAREGFFPTAGQLLPGYGELRFIGVFELDSATNTYRHSYSKPSQTQSAFRDARYFDGALGSGTGAPVVAGPIQEMVEAGSWALSALSEVWGALHQAAWSGRVEDVDRALDDGTTTDALTPDGRSALAMAAERGQLGALRRLLARGAMPDAGSWTALMAAAVRDDVEAATVLLDAGADLARRGGEGGRGDATERTAQEHAEHAWAWGVAALLAERTGGFATVAAAIAAGHHLAADPLGAARALLDEGADPNTTLGRSHTPALHFAACPEAVELLMGYGADVHAVDDAGRDAVAAIVAADPPQALACIEALLAHGADPKRRGVRALWEAAGRSFEIARRLIEAGSPVDSGIEAFQPLHAAARKLAKLLLAHGARLEPVARTATGGWETPLHAAADVNAVAVVELLLARGADPGALCHDEQRDEDRGEEDRDTPEYDTEGGITPLHCAAQAGSFDALVLLLRHDSRGARHAETAAGERLVDLAAEHPRCLALLHALEEKGDLDAALAMSAER